MNIFFSTKCYTVDFFDDLLLVLFFFILDAAIILINALSDTCFSKEHYHLNKLHFIAVDTEIISWKLFPLNDSKVMI